MTTYPPPDQSYQQQQSPRTNFIPQYAEPPQSHSPRAPLPPGFYPNTDPSLQQTPQAPLTRTPQSNGDHKNANRLRKACDSCSIRKVKCDEAGPPCKACVALDIPCTFDRPSKRRGPPNRLAESIKKQRVEPPVRSGNSLPTSPIHAAHTLASFAQQQVLSADAICPSPVLHLLIDDYFSFIHPLIPVPHEPSFRQALEHRQDLTSPTFLALMASMIGCLTASFPSRPGQHFKTHGLEHMYHSSMNLIDRCQKVAVEAHGPATFIRAYTVHDAIISYLQGLTNIYTLQRQPAMMYFKETLSILTTLALHKMRPLTEAPNGLPVSSTGANGNYLDGSRPPATDLVVQELAKRVFWVLFVGIKTLQQLGMSPFEIYVPPSTRSDPYPPLPTEIDDAYLTPTHMMQQPDGHISELTGFNTNIKVFLTYDTVSLNDFIYGVDELVDWDRQKKELEQSLDNIKRLLNETPASLAFKQGQNYDSPTQKYELPGPINITTIEERMRMHQELQKVNIHANRLGTRTWLIEKYFNLSKSHNPNLHEKPTSLDGVISAESSSTINDLHLMLSTIQLNQLEPNGSSLIAKLRTITSTLLRVPRTQKDSIALKSEEHLHAFVDALERLERTMGASERGNDEDEESRSREWANFKEVQARFERVRESSREG